MSHNSEKLDNYDHKILNLLQENAEISMADLGDQVGLSHTPCWRRVKRLQESGFIAKQVTLLNAQKLDLNVSVHAYITIKSHAEEALLAFESAVQGVNEIVECYNFHIKRSFSIS